MCKSIFKKGRYTVAFSEQNEEWQIFYKEPNSKEYELIADGFKERAQAVAYLMHNE